MIFVPPGLYHQPLFPYKDIDDSNIELLGLIFSDREIIEIGHQIAEKEHSIYELGHPGVEERAKETWSEERARAVSFGFGVIEAMNTHVAGQFARNIDGYTAGKEIRGVVTAASELEWEDYMQEAYEEFCHDMPVTAAVVGSIGEAHYDTAKDKVVLGAALGRKVVMEAAERMVLDGQFGN